MKTQALLLSLLALVALGCGSVHSEFVMTGRKAAPPPGDVHVVMEGTKSPPNIREIAILQVVASGTKAELEPALDELKRRAKTLGCDTVVNVRVDRGQNMSVTGVCGVEGEGPAESAPSAPAANVAGTDELGD